MIWIAIFIAFTGLIWGFQWFAGSVYWIASGGKKLNVFEETYSAKPADALKTGAPAEDLIWHNMKREHPEAEIMEVHYPTHDSASIEVAINPDAGTYWKADYRYFNRYTLEEMQVRCKSLLG